MSVAVHYFTDPHAMTHYMNSWDADPGEDRPEVLHHYKDKTYRHFPTKTEFEGGWVRLPVDSALFFPAELHGVNIEVKVEHQDDHRQICEHIFATMNQYPSNPIADPKCLSPALRARLPEGFDGQAWMNENGVQHTSLSVGDIVQIGEVLWICRGCGFENLTELWAEHGSAGGESHAQD